MDKNKAIKKEQSRMYDFIFYSLFAFILTNLTSVIYVYNGLDLNNFQISLSLISLGFIFFSVAFYKRMKFMDYVLIEENKLKTKSLAASRLSSVIQEDDEKKEKSMASIS